MNETKPQPNNPLHGVTLEKMLIELNEHYGWEYLGYTTNINCFTNNPTLKSCLKMLRKNQWAKEKTEAMYIKMLANIENSNL